MHLRKSNTVNPTEVAAVAVFNEDGDMLWGLRSDTDKYTTPGGHLEPNEDPLDGAVRELWEESDIDNAVLEPLGSMDVGRYIVHGFKTIVPNNTKPTSVNDPDKEVYKWVWAPVYQNSIPDQIKENLHAPKNVLLTLMGMDGSEPISELDKSEHRDIVVCIPKSRIAQVEEEEKQVQLAVKKGLKPPTYYWTVHRLPKQQPRRIYFCWNGAIQAYHDVVGMVNQPDARILMDHRIHNIQPIKTDSFRGWRYYNSGTDMEKTEKDLGHSAVEEGGVTFQTGKPVTFKAIRNNTPAPKIKDDSYQQSIEPHGRYMVHGYDVDKVKHPWTEEHVSFKNPLVISLDTIGDYKEGSWKKRLSDHYKAKGAKLSQKITKDGYDGIVTTQFHPVYNRDTTSEIVDLRHLHLNKSEHDEVSLLLTNPDPTERAIALKLDGVRRHHLEYALSSNDPILESLAAKHPGLDTNIVGSIFEQPYKYALKRTLLQRNDLTHDHLLILLRGLQDHQTESDPDKDHLLDELLNDRRCTTDLLQERWDYARDSRVIKHPNCPISVLEAVLNTELETRVPLSADAFIALSHPKCPPMKVSRAIGMLEPNRCCAASANPDLTYEQIRYILETATRPDQNAYAEARQLCLRGWNVNKDHLDIALADPNVRVRCAVFKTPSLSLDQSHIDKALASNIPELIEASAQARIAPFNAANGGLLMVKSEGTANPFTEHAKRFVAGLEVNGKVAYRDVKSTAKGTIYVIEPHIPTQGTSYFGYTDTWPNAELAAYAVYKAANMERSIVRCTLLQDKVGKDVLLRELNGDWQPIAQITKLDGRTWTTGIDTDIVMQEVARIAVLDYLLGNLYRHGHSLFWDDNSKRFIATDFGTSCFQYKAAQSTAGLPKYGEKDSLLPYVIGDRTCIKDLNCARWLGQAIGWIECHKEDILEALEPHWDKLGMEAKVEFLNRLQLLSKFDN